MRKVVVAGIAAFALQGCALMPWAQAHIAQIALVGTVAGAVSATESAVVNGIELGKEIKK